MRKVVILAAMLALSTGAAMADAFEDGATAWRNGDYRTAMNAWKPLADKDATIQNNYGVMYMDGKGVTRNYDTARLWFARAAANGSPLGQNNLGGLYRDGKGVPRDYGKALTFFRASASQGNAAAQVNLGLMLMNGQGIAVDTLHAYMWFDLAAQQNLPQAVTNRTNLRQHMTSHDVDQANKLSQRCKSQDFKGCA
jgi:TPR repeat protein